MAKGQSNAIDLMGKRFGKLVVLKRTNNIVSSGRCVQAVWECQCDCGNIINVRGYCLRDGNTKSCGCARKETLSAKFSTHGKSATRLYKIWSGIKKRCDNPNSSVYRHYGGRGIGVCKEWENDFMAFYHWATKNGYEDTLSIDRIDVNLGYYPQNCKWSTQKEQTNNTRRNHRIKYMGMNKTLSEWGDYLDENPNRISWRLNHGWSDAGALLGVKACAGEIATKERNA